MKTESESGLGNHRLLHMHSFSSFSGHKGFRVFLHERKSRIHQQSQMLTFVPLSCQVHIKECPECANRQKDLSENDDFIHQLRESVQIYETSINNETQSNTSQYSLSLRD